MKKTYVEKLVNKSFTFDPVIISIIITVIGIIIKTLIDCKKTERQSTHIINNPNYYQVRHLKRILFRQCRKANVVYDNKIYKEILRFGSNASYAEVKKLYLEVSAAEITRSYKELQRPSNDSDILNTV